MDGHVRASVITTSGGKAQKLGIYLFQALPREGERIGLDDQGDDILWMIVRNVTHMPFAEADKNGISVISIACEIEE